MARYAQFLVPGLLSAAGAALADLDAWRRSGGKFSVKIAFPRWASAFVAGALAGLGIQQP